MGVSVGVSVGVAGGSGVGDGVAVDVGVGVGAGRAVAVAVGDGGLGEGVAVTEGEGLGVPVGLGVAVRLSEGVGVAKVIGCSSGTVTAVGAREDFGVAVAVVPRAVGCGCNGRMPDGSPQLVAASAPKIINARNQVVLPEKPPMRSTQPYRGAAYTHGSGGQGGSPPPGVSTATILPRVVW